MERLLGVETEYAFAALNHERERITSGRVLRRLMSLAGRRLSYLPDESAGGMFLQNGARFYVDSGHHPEFSTPECNNPWEVVRYIRAGERTIGDLAHALEQEQGEISEALVLRSNVDYGGTGSTWGCHESYLHLRNPSIFPEQLIPHLVSRIVYTGAGGFNSLALSALEFTLSPRVWHLEHEISGESTHSRGIFHTKDESLSDQRYHRLHILCGESLCSELATWLKIGTTALVVALIDGGVRPGNEVRLHSSLAAMRRFASDPSCRAVARLRDGTEVTALAIQRHYLQQAEAHLRCDFMPSFAEAVCERWRAMLDKLEHAPDSVATELDWAIKLPLYVNRARRHGVAWESLPSWNHVLIKLSEPYRDRMCRDGRVPLDVLLSRHGSGSRVARELTQFLRERGLKWEGLKTFVKLQSELFEIDARFGQLGDRGIFTCLDRAGVISHRVPGVDNIEHALENPPQMGRARVRGERVRELAGERDHYITSWEKICDLERRRTLDLTDPFAATEPEWKDWGSHEEYLAAVHGRLGRSMFRGRRASLIRQFLDY